MLQQVFRAPLRGRPLLGRPLLGVPLFGLSLLLWVPACGDDDHDAPAASDAATKDAATNDSRADSPDSSGDGGVDASMPAQGGEGQPCYPNGTCNAGLSCFSKLCVDVTGDAASDTQPPLDGSHTGDAPSRDATSEPDGIVWSNGKVIDASLTIPSGVTVTIAPGATVTLGPAVTVTVQGSLTGSARTAKATLTGSAWGGLIVDRGGTLALDGVNIVNAASAIVVHAQNASATYDYATITQSAAPFTVNQGATLSTSHGSVTATTGTSTIKGAFTASHLSYDAGTSNVGISVSDPSARVALDDSTLRGSSGDLFSLAGAASVHIAYCVFQNAHTLVIASNVTSFDISYSDFHGATYAFALYAANATGTRTISRSNIYDNDFGVDAQTTSPITISDSYFTNNRSGDLRLGTSPITVTNQAAVRVAGTGPRP